MKPHSHLRLSARGIPGLLVALCTLLLPCSCDNSTHLSVAVAQLNNQRHKLTEREQAAARREEELARIQRRIETAERDLRARQAELAAERRGLEGNLQETKRFAAHLAERERSGPAPAIDATSAIVIAAGTQDVLFEKNADLPGPAANLQQLLTGLLVLDQGNLQELVPIQKEDTRSPPFRFGLTAGESYVKEELLAALFARSANDIALALARHTAGSVDAFVDQMNHRAAALGMTQSYFVNPHGLSAECQETTARDLATLAAAASSRPRLAEFMSARSCTLGPVGGEKTTVENNSRLLETHPWCRGYKSGYTDASGSCIIALGEREGQGRIIVVLHASRESALKDTQNLLDWSLRGVETAIEPLAQEGQGGALSRLRNSSP